MIANTIRIWPTRNLVSSEALRRNGPERPPHGFTGARAAREAAVLLRRKIVRLRRVPGAPTRRGRFRAASRRSPVRALPPEVPADPPAARNALDLAAEMTLEHRPPRTKANSRALSTSAKGCWTGGTCWPSVPCTIPLSPEPANGFPSSAASLRASPASPRRSSACSASEVSRNRPPELSPKPCSSSHCRRSARASGPPARTRNPSAAPGPGSGAADRATSQPHGPKGARAAPPTAARQSLEPPGPAAPHKRAPARDG